MAKLRVPTVDDIRALVKESDPLVLYKALRGNDDISYKLEKLNERMLQQVVQTDPSA